MASNSGVHEHSEEIERSRSRPAVSSAGSSRLTPLPEVSHSAGTGRPASASLSNISVDELQIRNTSPLPPIAGLPGEPGRSPTESLSSVIASTVAGGGPPSRTRTPRGRYPRVLGYRRETDPETASEGSEGKGSRAVSFSRQRRKQNIASREVGTLKGRDGGEVTVVSIECQTDWSWLEDMQASGRTAGASPSKGASRSSMTGSRAVEALPSDDDDDDLDLEEDEDLPKLPSNSRKKSRDHTSKIGGTISDTASQRSRGSRFDGTNFSEISEAVKVPAPYEDDTYGIPILDISSTDSDMSDDDIEDYKSRSDLDSDLNTLPSIGPPQILQYNRESDKGALPDTIQEEMDAPEAEAATPAGGMFDGVCEFCNENIRPFPNLEMQKNMAPEELYCCEDYRHFVQFMLTHPLHEQFNVDKLIDVGPHPPHGSKQARRAAKERAAQRMRERELARQQAQLSSVGSGGGGGGGGGGPSNFYQFARQMKTINFQLSSQKCLEEGWTLRPPSPMADENDENEIFEPEPHQPPWAGGHRHSKSSVSTNALTSVPQSSSYTLGTASNLLSRVQSAVTASSFTTSSRIIRSHVTMGQHLGSPLRSSKPNSKLQSISCGNTDLISTAYWAKDKDNGLVQKYYEDGQPFLTLFPDGTGTVYYPSGNIAISISSVEQGLFTYIVSKDDEENPDMLGVFEPDGHATTYYSKGLIRVCLDPFGGIELDAHGFKKRKWTWKEQVQHVHAPPIQPLTFAISAFISLRIMGQDNISLTYKHSRCSVRFQVGAKLKVLTTRDVPALDLDDDGMFREEIKTRIQNLFSRVTTLLKFPNSPKAQSMPSPTFIANRLQRMERSQSSQRSGREKTRAVIVN